MKSVKFILLALLPLVGGCGEQSKSQTKEAFNERNQPSDFGIYNQQAYDQWPSEGRVQQRLWSGDYWPTFRGGISSRWQSGTSGESFRNFLYPVINRSDASRLSDRQIAGLSPSEKYDLWLNRSDFPLTSREKTHTRNSVQGNDVPHWWGICHGWAHASIHEQAPGTEATVRNAAGQSIKFYASDMKALISHAYGEYVTNNRNALYLGSRCNEEQIRFDAQGRAVSSSCRDVNPGAFHLLMQKHVGIDQDSLIIETNGADQVWNYPVEGFATRYRNYRRSDARDPLSRYRAPGTNALVDVEMKIAYAAGSQPSRSPVRASIQEMNFYYTLELDSRDRIIGGEWAPNAERPDFLWKMNGTPSGTSGGLSLERVRYLVNLSNGDVNPPPPPPPPPPPGNDALYGATCSVDLTRAGGRVMRAFTGYSESQNLDRAVAGAKRSALGQCQNTRRLLQRCSVPRCGYQQIR